MCYALSVWEIKKQNKNKTKKHEKREPHYEMWMCSELISSSTNDSRLVTLDTTGI
jgi:hypothetical protein